MWGNVIKRSSCRIIMGFLWVLLTSGCAKLYLGEGAFQRNPIEDPATNITNFSDALQCMDELMLQFDVPPVILTAQDIPNMTANKESDAGTKDMLITSLSQISERSGKVRFVAYGTDLRDILLLHGSHKKKSSFKTPDFFIRGAITQMDKSVVASRFGGALDHRNWNGSLSAGQGLSYISLDLNVGLISNLQMLPGMTSNNVLAITDRGLGTEVGGRIEKVGAYFDFGIDRRDGLHQAIRNLVDLGVIEVVGKLTDVPYLSCLPIDYNDPMVVAEIRKEYESQREKGYLIRTIQGALKQYNYYTGELDGEMNEETQLAIHYFRNLYGLSGTHFTLSDVNFALYKEIVYNHKYHWEYDVTAMRQDVKSYEHESLILNDRVERREDDYRAHATYDDAGWRYHYPETEPQIRRYAQPVEDLQEEENAADEWYIEERRATPVRIPLERTASRAEEEAGIFVDDAPATAYTNRPEDYSMDEGHHETDESMAAYREQYQGIMLDWEENTQQRLMGR